MLSFVSHSVCLKQVKLGFRLSSLARLQVFPLELRYYFAQVIFAKKVWDGTGEHKGK